MVSKQASLRTAFSIRPGWPSRIAGASRGVIYEIDKEWTEHFRGATERPTRIQTPTPDHQMRDHRDMGTLVRYETAGRCRNPLVSGPSGLILLRPSICYRYRHGHFPR